MSKGIWNEIIRFKYIHESSLEDFTMTGWQNQMGASTIWNGFKLIWAVFASLLRWNFGIGDKILIR